MELSLHKAENDLLFKDIEKRSELLSFIAWCATPEPLRELRTMGDFSMRYNVSRDTLTDWKKRPGFWDEVKKLTREWGKERTPNIIAATYQNALKPGGTRDRELWLKYIEQWAERQEIDQRSLMKVIYAPSEVLEKYDLIEQDATNTSTEDNSQGQS